MKQFCIDSNILDRVNSSVWRSKEYSLVLKTLQLIFWSWSVDPWSRASRFPVYSYPLSQQIVYGVLEKYPVFKHVGRGATIPNMDYLPHVANYFRYHMMSRSENDELRRAFRNLDRHELPQVMPYRAHGYEGIQPLGMKWKFVSCK